VHPYISKCVCIYLDDVLTFSKTDGRALPALTLVDANFGKK
jgi:hypothetical protein